MFFSTSIQFKRQRAQTVFCLRNQYSYYIRYIQELSSLRSRLASSALRRSPSPPRVTGGLFSWRNSWRLRCEDDDAERWLKEVAEREMGMVAVSEKVRSNSGHNKETPTLSFKEYDPDGRSWYVALLPSTSPLPSMPSELLSAGAAAANGMEEGAVKVEVATDLVTFPIRLLRRVLPPFV